MGRLLGIVVLALLAAAPAARAEPSFPLGHEGRWVTDRDGRVVVLHGVNMVYKRPPYAPDAIGFDEADAAWLASEGYNNVRVGLIYAAVEPQPGVYDDAYLARIERTVNLLGEHGIVSQLDFHQDLYNERFQGEGWPEWAVIDDGLPAEPKSGFPGNYLVMPALWRAFDHFWANDPGPGGVGLQDRYAAAWRHVASRFRDNKYVFGYDLLNEPWPGSTWQSCANSEGCPVFDAMLSQFVARSIAAIRTVDRDTVVYYEPNVIFNNGAKTHVAPPPGEKAIGFSFHDYCLPAGQSDSDQGCGFFDDLVFINAEEHSRSTGAALLLTEFGATSKPDIITSMATRADRNMVGWQWWHYCGCDDPTTAGPGDKQALVRDPKKPPTGENLDTGKLAILTRPYPQLVSGTPTAWDYDLASRRFSLTYGATRPPAGPRFAAGSITEIALPKRAYPDGYVVQSEGAEVVSKPGDAVLKVASCKDVDTIRVTVLAAGEAKSTCKAPVLAQPRLLVTLKPSKIRAGRRVRVRVRVRSLDGSGVARALRGARVTLRGAKTRRTNRKGDVLLRLHYRRPGRRRITARAPGYARGSATLRVVRR